MHAQRLLNVARALRESPNPGKFQMGEWHFCGTPGCAIGHYAARRDLQDFMMLWDAKGLVGTDGNSFSYPDLAYHFGITLKQYDELFDVDGCGDATTAIAAAQYIEDFVRRHSPASIPDSVRNIFDMTPAQIGESLATL